MGAVDKQLVEKVRDLMGLQNSEQRFWKREGNRGGAAPANNRLQAARPWSTVTSNGLISHRGERA